MEVPEANIDQLLRTAITQKRLVQFIYKNKPRIVEPHDYGIHKGRVKLFGYQVDGSSSEPLPNWRWTLVNSVSDLRLLNQTFPGRRPAPSGKHHQWDQIFIRVDPPEQKRQPLRSSSSSLITECSAKLRNTAAVLPPRSLPKKGPVGAAHGKQRSVRSV